MHLKMLMWKDFRQQTGFLIGAIIVLLIPHLIAAGTHVQNHFGDHRVENWYVFYEAACIADVLLAALLIAFFAGNAIAGERSDGSADFFAYLPVPKRTSTLSKLLVAVALSSAILALCVAISSMFSREGRSPRPTEVKVFFATLIAMFGVAWGVSSFVRSAAYAAASGICVPIALGIMLALISADTPEGKVAASASYSVVATVLGIAVLTAGTIYYVKRVEP